MDKVRLVGGFECELTPSEVNSFREFIGENSVFKDLTSVKIEIEILKLLIQGGPTTDLTDRLRGFYKQEQYLFKQLYEISKKWYNENIYEMPEIEK